MSEELREPVEDQTDWMSVIEKRRVGLVKHSTEWRDPGKVVKALTLLSGGEVQAKVAADLDVHETTIQRWKWRYLGSIEEAQKAMAVEAGKNAEKYLGLSGKRADQLAEDDKALAKVNPKDLAVTAAIHADKMVALSGGATSVVEHRKAFTLEDAMRMKAEAEERVREARGRVIDVEGESDADRS